MSGDRFDFEKLFIFDIANNHQGSLVHGKRIIDEIARVADDENIRGALKFQFRHIDTLIHPDFKDTKTLPHIPRFVSTKLEDEDYEILATCVSEGGMTTMATPFDEESVGLIDKLGIEIIKIASCSADDKPLIERIAKARKPVVVSTAGLNINAIDGLVSFFNSKKIHFALMHCVALYPTPLEKMQLNQIEAFRKRYHSLPIGYSTHEPPDFLDGIKIAYTKGARIFEKHVGVATDKIKLNAYSATPDQIREWIRAFKMAQASCGAERRPPAGHDEAKSLNSLKRGVYVKRDMKKGDPLAQSDLFFAMPLQEKQMTSGQWQDDMAADKDYKKGEPVQEQVCAKDLSREDIINRIVLQIRGMLNEARIPLGKDFTIELSHHYGLDRFREFGAVIVDCINRAYCKKLIIQLPRQKHPYHFHKRKEETFQVLFGELEVELEGNRTKLGEGDSLVVHYGEWHKFQTANGVIVEEISTTHYNDDSFYEDQLIASLRREDRKTKITNWNV